MNTPSPTAPRFKTKTGQEIPGVDSKTLLEMRKTVVERYGVSPMQMAEAAGYSMAMVVRYALGLTAQEGQVCVIASDSLPGLVSLATLRHLINGGAAGAVLLTGNAANRSPEFEAQLKPLSAMGVPLEDLEPLFSGGFLERLLSDCHNVLWGASDISNNSLPHLAGVINALNEGRTPIHAVEAPGSIDPDTGKPLGAGLFASSTLSLGAPLIGLATGHDRVGRHYVCDVSIPRAVFEGAGVPWTPMFAEQPVVQIFPPGASA